MKTSIFYFSATGNSLHFARQLACKLKTNNLVSIAEAMQSKTHKPVGEKIGLVFPVYAWGPPRILMDFLQKFDFSSNTYIFSVVTCVGIPAKTLSTIHRTLRKKGATLDAGFIVKAGCASLMKMNTLDKIIIGLDRKRKRLKTGEERLDEIASVVGKMEKHKPEKSSLTANIFGTMFHNYGINYFKTAAQSFHVNKNCTGCGTCARICPRANISLQDGKPRFNNNCEFCHACIQWCPEFAITHPDFDKHSPQYRHPEVNVKDLFVNA